MDVVAIEITDKGVKRMLSMLAARVQDPRRAMKEIGESVRSSVLTNFMTGGRPEKWTPLAPATVKKKRNGPGKILIDSARLQNSITARAFTKSVRVGTKLRYAAIHQFGGTAGRKHAAQIPARPYLMVQNEDWVEIRETLLRHLMGGTT